MQCNKPPRLKSQCSHSHHLTVQCPSAQNQMMAPSGGPKSAVGLLVHQSAVPGVRVQSLVVRALRRRELQGHKQPKLNRHCRLQQPGQVLCQNRKSKLLPEA